MATDAVPEWLPGDGSPHELVPDVSTDANPLDAEIERMQEELR